MKKFRMQFAARPIGSLGIPRLFERTVEALDAEGARLALYEEFEHVVLHRRTELSDVGKGEYFGGWYLPDATDFTDLPRRQPEHDYTVECPKCHGYGGWNLKKNAYRGETPAQRDFRAHCLQCNGWGFVAPGPHAECAHDLVDNGRAGGLNVKCMKCGATLGPFDSSD